MGLGAVDLQVWERNKNTEFGMGPWTAVRKSNRVMGLGAVDLCVGERNKTTGRSLDCSEKEVVESWG